MDRPGAFALAPTSTETPIERGSVTRRDGQGVNRGNGSGSRASPGGCPGAPLPRVRGPLDQADRRPARPLAGDGQGVLLRPDRGEGAGGQGPLRRRVPRLRRLHPAAQRQGRRLRATARRCHPGAIERRWTPERVLAAMRDWREQLRPAAVVVRLVEHPRASTWGRRARAPRPRASGLRRVSSPACSARGASPARWLRSGLGR